MQESQQLARLVQVTKPSVPCRVIDAVAEARKHKGKHKRHKGRVRRNHDVRQNVARATQDGDTALAKLEMQIVVEQRRADVANEWGKEDERDDGVRQVIVVDELWMLVDLPWC